MLYAYNLPIDFTCCSGWLLNIPSTPVCDIAKVEVKTYVQLAKFSLWAS